MSLSYAMERYYRRRQQRRHRDMSFHERKAARTEYYFKYVFGWRLRTCTACNGSGHYDHNGAPPCGGCNGTGKERYRGPKEAPCTKLN